MIDQGLWTNATYMKIVFLVLLFIFSFGAVVFYMQARNPKWIGAWASVKSWLVVAPVFFAVIALPRPWPYVLLLLTSVYGSKTFFRMTGMYHRSWFVWASYLMVMVQGYLVYNSHDHYFNLMPMLFFMGLTLIPVFGNNSTNMIQYVALTLMNFIFFGWGFLHLGRILMWEGGLLIALHLAILSEFNETALHLGNRWFGKVRPIPNVTTRFSIEGFLFSTVLTVFLAFGLRSLLPERTEPYWIATGLSVAILGRLGSLTTSFIRRDLGIKDSGLFIIGRDDLLARMDRLVFVAPAVYYALLYLSGKL